MAESPKKKSQRAKATAAPRIGAKEAERSDPEKTSHGGSACPVALCPICAVVSLIQPLNPEVVEHLLNAGREFLLAAKAALDAVATDPTEKDDGSFEKIDIG